MPRRGRGPKEPGPGSTPVPELVVAGRAYFRGRLQPAEIGIDGSGTIVRLGRNLDGERRLDFGDSVLIPSATDLHVHTREPGKEGIEDLRTASLQAALGGVGLIGEMPNTDPPIDTPERVEGQLQRVPHRSAVDVLVYAVAGADRPIRSLGRVAGAFKLYLSPTTGVSEPPPPGGLSELLRAVADSRLPLTVHAEAPERFGDVASATTLEGWDAARPPTAEMDAVHRVLAAAPPALRLLVAHVTGPGAAARLRAAGHCFEATPQHLLLAADASSDPQRKVNPPLRDDATRRALLTEFDEGRVPILASDHAPHSLDAKGRPFAIAPSGVPGVETMLPLMLERVRSGDLPLPILMAAACDRPARWAGVPVGRLAVGHRADLLVVDFRARGRLEAARLHAPCGWTPFEGWNAVFPRHHLRAGRWIVQDGEYVGDRDGRPVRPEFAGGTSAS